MKFEDFIKSQVINDNQSKKNTKVKAGLASTTTNALSKKKTIMFKNP